MRPRAERLAELAVAASSGLQPVPPVGDAHEGFPTHKRRPPAVAGGLGEARGTRAVVRRVGPWTLLGKRAVDGAAMGEAHEVILNKRPRCEGPERLRVCNRSAPSDAVGAHGAPPVGDEGPRAGGAAFTRPDGARPEAPRPADVGPVGARRRRGGARPVGRGHLPAGPFWRFQCWADVTRNPSDGDSAELAAAELPDAGLVGEPDHRLWRFSPYGPVLRPHGAEVFPRAARHVHWGPVVRADRATVAHAAVWQPPPEPG